MNYPYPILVSVKGLFDDKPFNIESLGLVMENRSRLHGTILHYTNSDIQFEITPLGEKFYDAMMY